MKIILLSFLFYLPLASNAISLPPCWFNSPVNQQQLGFIGAASPFSAKVNGSLIASRKRALNKLFAYYNLEVNLKNVDLTTNKITLDNHLNIVFSLPYVDNQAMYSYASLEKTKNKKAQHNWLSKKCPLQTCNFKRCTPAWLCESNEEHMISVSQTTSNPAKQLEKTYENAQVFLQFISESKVDDHNYRVKSEGKFQQWGYSEHKGQIKALANKKKLLNTQSCQTPSYMFARYKILQQLSQNQSFNHEKIKHHKLINTKPFAVWRKEPNMKDTVGAIGIFSGISADGLFSSAIKHAIKEGLLELAKIKQINIEHNYQISNVNGLYSIAMTTMTTSTIVTATLQDIKIIEKNNQLVIYTWLLEVKK